MKNKNKSKKVQNYIAQVRSQAQGRGGKSELRSLRSGDEEEAQKQAEKEMMQMLGDTYIMDKKKAKKKKKEEAKKAAIEKEKKQKQLDEIDFGVPIALSDVFGVDSKVELKRIVGVLTKKDNLTGKNKDGTDYITAY